MNIIKKYLKKINIILIIIFIFFTFFIYAFDKMVIPIVMSVADMEIRAKTMDIINKVVIEEYSNKFNYSDTIKVEKDKDGNIVMLYADTLKLSKIASEVSLRVQKEFLEIKENNIKIPIGYITKNNILSYMGPKIKVKTEPIGFIETKYGSSFTAAGINQTNHKIYVEISCKMKVMVPFESNEVEVKQEIPIADTIIIGKVPDTSMNLDLNGAGIKMKN